MHKKLIDTLPHDSEKKAKVDIIIDGEAEAVEWYEKAAVQGYSSAQDNLGTMYKDGRSVPQDDAEAFEWFQSAAAEGYAPAQYNLGLMCEAGRDIPKGDRFDYL